MPTKIKICGICSDADAELAIKSGVDYLGLIFIESSPRYVEPEFAQNIITAVRKKIELDKPVQIVGVFQNESKSEIEEISSLIGLDLFQLHGNESPAFCRSLSKPVIKAFQISRKLLATESCCTLYATDCSTAGAESWLNILREYKPFCENFLFDRAKEDSDSHWLDYAGKELAAIEDKLGKYFLAGGLNVGNVGQALQLLRPVIVDVCSGIENMVRKKSRDMLEEFIFELRSKDILSRVVGDLVSNEVINL